MPATYRHIGCAVEIRTVDLFIREKTKILITHIKLFHYKKKELDLHHFRHAQKKIIQRSLLLSSTTLRGGKLTTQDEQQGNKKNV